MRTLLIIGCLLYSAGSWAAIYKCEVNGKATYSDRPCGASAQQFDAPKQRQQTEAQEQSGTDSIDAMAERYRRKQAAEKAARDEAIRQREEAESRPREIPGIVGNCPPPAAIQAAIRRNYVVQCMTTDEVLDAQGPKYNDHFVRSRLLDSGPMAVEWVYPRHPAQWPAIIRFINGYVVGFE